MTPKSPKGDFAECEKTERMETIKSEFNKNVIGGIIFLVLFYIPFIAFFLYFLWRDFFSEGINIVGVFILLPFVLLNSLILQQFFSRTKHIIIECEKIRYYSIFSPFGKTFYFDDLVGKILIHEMGKSVVYLVDKQNRTVFKIAESPYRNFKTLIKSIPLKPISFKPTIGQYWKLAVVEKMSIEEKKGSKDINKMFRLTSLVVIIVCATAIVLAIFMAIIRNVTL